MRPLAKAAILSSALGAVVLGSGGARGASPLPGINLAPKPVMIFLLDRTGTMNACDGGTVTSGVDFSLSLYNPLAALPAGSDNPGADGDTTDECDDDRVNGTPYKVTRMEAAKIAMAKILDANGDGAINATDEGLLNVKVGLAYFPNYPFSSGSADCANAPAVATPFARTATEERFNCGTVANPIGDSFANIWAKVRDLPIMGGQTPSGAALAMTRSAMIQRCYDGSATTTGCNLGTPGVDIDAVTGDDLSLTCRPYYVVFLTDGEPTHGSSGCKAGCGSNTGTEIGIDVLPIAKSFRDMTKAHPNEAMTPLKQVRLVSVGIGANARAMGTTARGFINCTGYFGSDATSSVADSNDDLDGVFTTMRITTAGTAVTTGNQCDTAFNMVAGMNNAGACAAGNSMTTPWPDPWPTTNCALGAGAATRGVGNGFFAQDAQELSTTFQQILATVITGTFAGGEPTFSVNAGGVASGNSVFGAFYDVDQNKKERFGHLRKYRFDTSINDYVDCDDGGTPAGLPIPCWDAGGVMVVSSAGFQARNEAAYGDVNNGASTYAAPGSQPANYLGGLSERNWLSRRVFLPNPAVVTSGFYDRDEYKDFTRRPDPASSARTIAPLVPSLSPLPLLLTLANIAALPATERANLETWLMWATTESTSGGGDTVKTYQASDYPQSIAVMNSSGQALMFLAGRPTSTFYDLTNRCAGCVTDDAFSPKFGYPNRSRPIVIGPPAAFSTDGTYLGTPGVDDSGFLETVLTNPYTGADAVIERDEAYSYGAGYNPLSVVPANPCGEGFSGPGNCKVKLRRKVVYIAGNDGAVHAFDEATGHELWSFVPTGMLRKLKNMRNGGAVTLLDGTATVRDVRFPSITGNRMADGKWHTIMIYSVGLGGRFYFALDVTNPVNPVFMWENFDDEIGYTVSRPAIAEVPNGSFDASEPGSIVFAAGGMLPAGEGSRNSIMSYIRPFDGIRQGHTHSPLEDLADSETATSLQNGLTGEPRAVDANGDGKTDRVYVGDVEGRMWKICDIPASGVANGYELFFDPALYDDPHGTGPGYPDNNLSNGADSSPFASLSDAAQRKQLRGPISFAPDITHDGTGNLLVAFGSGNIFDVLTTPTAYKNFVWVVEDNEAGGGAATCQAPTTSACAGNSDPLRNTVVITTPSPVTYPNVLKLDELLTGPPQILNSFLVYPEFKRTGSTCSTSYESHVVARDVFTCGVPATTAFSDPDTGVANVITYTDTLVTGLQVDPSSGTLFLQTSTGTAPPEAISAPGMASTTANLGFRQVY